MILVSGVFRILAEAVVGLLAATYGIVVGYGVGSETSQDDRSNRPIVLAATSSFIGCGAAVAFVASGRIISRGTPIAIVGGGVAYLLTAFLVDLMGDSRTGRRATELTSLAALLTPRVGAIAAFYMFG